MLNAVAVPVPLPVVPAGAENDFEDVAPVASFVFKKSFPPSERAPPVPNTFVKFMAGVVCVCEGKFATVKTFVLEPPDVLAVLSEPAIFINLSRKSMAGAPFTVPPVPSITR